MLKELIAWRRDEPMRYPQVFVHGVYVGGWRDGPEPWMGVERLLRTRRIQCALAL